jgi:hypothetical protein
MTDADKARILMRALFFDSKRWPEEGHYWLIQVSESLFEDIADWISEDEKPDAQQTAQVVNDMVNKFLTWPVPPDVYPDGTPGQPGRTGTNLLNAPQARAMFEYVLQYEGRFCMHATHGWCAQSKCATGCARE